MNAQQENEPQGDAIERRPRPPTHRELRDALAPAKRTPATPTPTRQA
jgi:hypothetical protein